MIRDKLLKNAKKLHLDTHDEVLDELAFEWEKFESQLKLLQKIDVTNIKPLTHPVEIITSYLRSDTVDDVLSKNVLLSNSPKSNNDLILVPKVVDND